MSNCSFLRAFAAATALFVFGERHAVAQDRQYLSAMLEPATRKSAAYYREPAGRDGELFKGRIHGMDGKLKAEGTYADAKLTIPHGQFVFYHPNGKVESRGRYESGYKSGVWQRFDQWGRPLAEKVYDPEPLVNIVYTKAQTMPRYPGGGEREFVRYMKQQIPARDERQLDGPVTTSFIVERDGQLTDIKVTNEVPRAVEERLVKAVRSTSPWEPGLDKGQPVRVRMRIPVDF